MKLFFPSRITARQFSAQRVSKGFHSTVASVTLAGQQCSGQWQGAALRACDDGWQAGKQGTLLCQFEIIRQYIIGFIEHR